MAATTSTDTVDPTPPTRASDDPADGRPELGWVVAALSAAAGVIHFAMIPGHSDSTIEPILFALAGWFQLGVAALIVARKGSKTLYAVTAAGTLAILVAWVWSRTAGLPFGAHANEAEDVTVVDAAAAALEVGVVVVSLRLVLGDARQRVGALVPALGAIAAITLGTIAVTSDDAASHGHSEETAATVDAHTAEMDRIDAARCDKSFNHQSYWDETETLAVDTYAGGTMSMAPTSVAATAGHDDGGGHSHGQTSATAPVEGTSTTQPDPTAGRGSPELDHLVGSTIAAGQGEAAAGKLIVDLADATEEGYDSWLYWMRSTGQVGHPHDTTSPDEGHGGHAGPHTWTALTDPVDCEALGDELRTARDVAMTMPTAQDAMDNGYRLVTYYLPGIAAHYINFSYIDTEFELDKPEMLLYDGNDPEASIVGLSYYLLGSPDLEPTQGFTGQNDHYHRHVGLCMRDGVIVGDTTLSEEQCAARGGFKLMTVAGWMSHAWVIPGCESPWGVFSAASPILDDDLEDASGTDGGGCGGSGVRDRYGLDDTSAAAADVESASLSEQADEADSDQEATGDTAGDPGN